jgi:protein-tyrosine-phosphatase
VKDVPEVLFVCVHNAGRSQMAAALLDHHAKGKVHIRSAGSDPTDQINPAVVAAMDEWGHRPVPEVPQAADRRLRPSRRRGDHHGLRGCLPDLSG